MNKKWILTMLCAFALLLLAGCTSNADVLPSPSPAATTMMPSPSILPSLMPASPSPGTESPSTAPGTSGAGVTTVTDAKKVSQDISTELQKLSEVSKASAVAAGNTAVVGLTFDSQYKGGMTTRISDMVKERIKTINTGITEVAVTDKADQIKTIETLMATLESGTTMTTLQTQVTDLYKNITASSGTTTKATPSPKP